tara:strand:+ start:696 stop:1064 length:369 start_codon:yes stop_codon:yes gene_type:complete
MTVQVKLFSYSKCGSCKKAIKWLQSNNIKYELINIAENQPSREIIIEGIKQMGNKKKLFNTSGKSYRAIGAEAVKLMTEEESIDALINDFKLIKRPFLIHPNGNIIVGFKIDIYEKTFINLI